jgi:ABC-type multidrug transport system ATPase subunit
MLELHNISKSFSGITAVDHVNFSARPGEITGYLGANGSGKSTTIKMIAGLLETVGRVSSRVAILHRGKIVADDSIERLRTLMELPTLEGIFSRLVVEQDTTAISREIADLIRA